MIESAYSSEADFVSRFLVRQIEDYVLSNKVDVELHLEESMGEGSADLTIRLNREKLLVVEAKIGTNPWKPCVVRKAYRYALHDFPFFATCNPEIMILFKTNSDPFHNTLSLVHYYDTWVEKILNMSSHPGMLQPLYRMLLKHRVIDAEEAEQSEAVRNLDPETVDRIEYEKPKYRLWATAGPQGPFPSDRGRYWSKEGAIENKAILESKGYTIKIQEKTERWVDLDSSQTTLDGS